MRIFTAVRHSSKPQLYYGNLWSENFYPALRELGHEIIESQTDLLPASHFMSIAGGFTREELNLRAEITERILHEVRVAQREGPIHLFLSYFYNSHFDPEGFSELRRLGIPSINFFCNSIYQFSLVVNVAAQVDYSWHAERDARSSYLAVGANPVWVQMGADPKAYQPVSNVVRQRKACFVGQRYADRDRLAAKLIRAGVPLDLYGVGWGTCEAESGKKDIQPSTHLGRLNHPAGSVGSYLQMTMSVLREEGAARGLVRLQKQWAHRLESRRITPLLHASAKGRASSLPEVLAGYEVALNFSNVWADGRPGSELIPHVRLRDFEAPMSRACYLTGYTDEISEFYEIGREIDTYKSPEELVDKTKYYLANAGAAEQLREAGYNRARRDHTWTRRFQQLFESVNLRDDVKVKAG